MLKIRRPLGRLIFNMGIAIPGKTVFLIETAPRYRKWVSKLVFGENVDIFLRWLSTLRCHAVNRHRDISIILKNPVGYEKRRMTSHGLTWFDVRGILGILVLDIPQMSTQSKKSVTQDSLTVACLNKEVHPSSAKPPLKFNGGLAKLGLTSLLK